MEAGLTMNCSILAAFARFGGAPGPLVGLLTGDEEIGSPEGRAVIEAEARRAGVVFNGELGRVSGNVGLISGGQSVSTAVGIAFWAKRRKGLPEPDMVGQLGNMIASAIAEAESN
jgi:acetylornithine deacetylase/succinyl-diaminopimelate desuccinylase-like protein